MITRLLADVGGTNTRIGLARDGALDEASIRSFRNEEFASFDAVLDAYGMRDALEMVVAVAGPVSDGTAELTNRDWSFEEAALSARFEVPQVRLMNDLSALGYASPALHDAQVDEIYMPQLSGPQEQSLVVGIGTGFNVSPVMQCGGQVMCLRAEYGHVALPEDVAERAPGRFDTVEELFSGRGYAAVDHDGLYAELMALMARHLTLAFLPKGGIYFAGGVARHVLSTEARSRFSEVFARPFALDEGLTAPVYVILDDAAALKGCAALQIT